MIGDRRTRQRRWEDAQHGHARAAVIEIREADPNGADVLPPRSMLLTRGFPKLEQSVRFGTIPNTGTSS